MSTVNNNHHSLFLNDVDLRHSTENEKEATVARQISPGNSVMVAAFEAMTAENKMETAEIIGFRLGENYKNLTGKTRSERSQEFLLKFIMQSEKAGGITTLLQENSSQKMNSDLFLAQQILQTGYLLTQQGHNPLRRRALAQQLEDLMKEEGWEIALFGALEFNGMPKQNLAPLKRLFQQVMDDEEYSVISFFEKIKEWSDRKRRIKILLRAMAFELNSQPASEKGRRLKVMIDRLKRLLLFLGLEERCQAVASSYQIEGDILLSEILYITAQSWVFKDWLEERLDNALNLKNKQKLQFIFDLTVLFKTMPDGCFVDDDHREQILEVLSSF